MVSEMAIPVTAFLTQQDSNMARSTGRRVFDDLELACSRLGKVVDSTETVNGEVHEFMHALGKVLVYLASTLKPKVNDDEE